MCPYGYLYDLFLGGLLRRVRLWIAHRIASGNWYPVLDLCCGTGDQLRRISRSPQPAVGLDRDFPLLHYARTQNRRIPLICADAGSLPFRNSAFRCVIISFALHEKDPDFRFRMLQEAKRVTMPEGWLIILDYEIPWNLSSRTARIFIGIIELLAGKHHFRFFRNFLNRGGLNGCLLRNNIPETESRLLKWGNSRIVLSHMKNQRPSC